MPQRYISRIKDSEKHKKQLHQIGLYLREIRISDGLNQVEAAERINISVGCLQGIEHGNNVTVETLYKISDAYDMQMTDFFSDLD